MATCESELAGNPDLRGDVIPSHGAAATGMLIYDGTGWGGTVAGKSMYARIDEANATWLLTWNGNTDVPASLVTCNKLRATWLFTGYTIHVSLP